ncbi:MAG: elongation factor P--(R)-beta-lysine ligase [Gammaproteobacteria bacterium]|nr:elongation factor P--(R)-beta-lysine ligase [Gammaproteobacteria bacterium]
MNWQPSATVETLKQRAKFLAKVRRFFADRNVMEVETPILSQGTVTDVHLDAFTTQFEHSSNDSGSAQLYLQTSPEFAMKRLLAAGSGAIYQLGKAFRNECAGRFHNPEFTMLEWYRPGYDDHQLMAEVDDLVQNLLACSPAVKLTYQQAFQQYLNIDPLTITTDELKTLVLTYSDDDWLRNNKDKDIFLQWLFSMRIEPQLGKLQQNDSETFVPCFVYDFPASQASLAKVNEVDSRVAHRFELYFQGVELANGFYELQDADEQLQRFQNDNELRRQNHLPQKPVDKNFIDALQSGLPECSGVALGIDRLFMLQQGISTIAQVLSFDINKA